MTNRRASSVHAEEARNGLSEMIDVNILPQTPTQRKRPAADPQAIAAEARFLRQRAAEARDLTREYDLAISERDALLIQIFQLERDARRMDALARRIACRIAGRKETSN